jgi:hypothetical protein
VRHVEEALAPRPPTGVTTRPSKHATATSTAYDVLYDPRAASEQRGLRWLAMQGALRVRRTCAQRDRRPCSGREATPRLAVGGSVGGDTEAIKAKEMEPQHGLLPTPKSWGREGWTRGSAHCPPSRGW